MALRENIYYWHYSLQNPEPLFDESYIFDEIIVNKPDLLTHIHRLRDLILAYCVNMEKSIPCGSILEEIYGILVSVEKSRYTEFVAFWKTADMSYTLFMNLPEENRIEILERLLKTYCKRRISLYKQLGFSDLVSQALYDSGASRRKKSSGLLKVLNLLKESFKNIEQAFSYEQLLGKEFAFALPDNIKEPFEVFCNSAGVEYSFGRTYQNKKPDLVIKLRKKTFVLEAKHIKEEGGAQDKQISELISFVSQEEKSEVVHYIAFLDGSYFNKFINPQGKARKQREDIERSLASHGKNFLNAEL